MDTMEAKVSRTMLLAFYGEMLTENQRGMAQLHWEEDLSLNEIAEQYGVSRQCVHDTLTRVEGKLNGYEDKLGLVKRFEAMEAGLNACREELSLVKADPATQEHLNAARRQISALLYQEEQ